MSRPPKPVRYEKKPMYPVARGRAPEVVEPARGADPRPVAESSEGGGSDYAISAAQRDARHRPPRTCFSSLVPLVGGLLAVPRVLGPGGAVVLLAAGGEDVLGLGVHTPRIGPR